MESFSFDHSKGMSIMDLSSYLRSEAVKLESKEKISDEDLLSIFSESLKFITKNLNNLLLTDLISLIRICWHENSVLLWEKNSDYIISISKKYINAMIIVASISPFTINIKNSSNNSAYINFFKQFIQDSFNEINENYANIENKDCDSFLVYEQTLNRKQFLYFLFELIQAIPYSIDFIPKYLPFLLQEMPAINTYSLYSFFIKNELIHLLPRKIFTDHSFLEYASLPNSLILLNEINDNEFLAMFQFYYRKIVDHKYDNSQIAYTFLVRLSKISSEHVVHFMNKSSSEESKSRIQIIIDFASECEFSKEVLLNLKQFRFHLPESVSKKIKSLGDDPLNIEYLAIISYNPLQNMDRSQLDPLLLSSKNPHVYNNLFRFFNNNDQFFQNLQFWSHIIPLFKKINIQQSHQFLFVRVEPGTVSKRIADLFLFNFPQNMKSDFFEFAKRILTQENLIESFTNSDDSKILLSHIQNYVPFEFWKLFCSYEPILSTIGNDYEKHLPLTLGLTYFLFHQFRVHASPPDPKIKIFKIEEQTEESVEELYSLAKSNPNMNTDLSNLSNPALSVVTAAYLYVSLKLNKFADINIEGINDNIFLPFFIIISSNLSSISTDYLLHENNIYRFNNRHEAPILSFLNRSNFSKRLINSFNSIDYENADDSKTNTFISSVLKLFINLNDNIVINANEPLSKILKTFSEHPDFYLRLDSPNSKLMAQFYGKLLIDIYKSNQVRHSNNIQLLIRNSNQSYIIRLLIAYPFEYSSKPLDSQTIKKIIQEEKEKGDHNVNIILFLTNDFSLLRDKKNVSFFDGDELLLMANQAIEENNEKLLRTIISYGKENFAISFAPLLDQKIPIDIKLSIFSKIIPIENKPKNIYSKEPEARKIVTTYTIISIIKEIQNISLFRKLFEIFFYFLLDEPTMINYYLIQFESQYDFTPLNEIKLNGKLGTSEFEIAFKKAFQIMQIGKKKCIIKRPNKLEFEQPSEYTIQFLNMLIDDFIDQPSWQIITTLYFIATNFPFLFYFADRVDSIFENLFELFKIFEKYQTIPYSQKIAYNKKHKQPNNNDRNTNAFNFRFQNHENFFRPSFYLENDDDNNENNADQAENDKDKDNFQDNENDQEIANSKNTFYAAYSGLSFLGAFVSIPRITDKFFQWSLSNFSNFTKGQIVSFISIIVPVLNRETAQHAALSYLIKYDWISLFTKYYENIEKPVTKFSRYILASLLRITLNYYLKYIHLFTPEMAATCDELMKIDNPFEMIYDYKTQISPIFSPWLSVKEYEIKSDQARNVLNGNQLNLDGNHRANMLINHLPFFQNRINGNRQNANADRPNFHIDRFNFNVERPNNNLDRQNNAAEQPEPNTENNSNTNSNSLLFDVSDLNQDMENNNMETLDLERSADNPENTIDNTENTNNLLDITINSENPNMNSNENIEIPNATADNTNSNSNTENNNNSNNNERPNNNPRRPPGNHLAFHNLDEFISTDNTNPFRVIRGHPIRNFPARSTLNRILNSGALRQAFSNFGTRFNRDFPNNRPQHRPLQPRTFTNLYLNGIRANDASNRDFDESYHLQFWSIFHLTDDEFAFVKDSIFNGDGALVNYSAGTSLTSAQINSLVTPNEPVDLSHFDHIQNQISFNALDMATQSVVLRNEIKSPLKLTPKMQRYLITKPQWVTAYLSSPPPPSLLLTPQHYVIIQEVLTNLKQMQNDEGDETESFKQFLKDFLLTIHNGFEKTITLFLSPEFALSYLSNYELRNGMVNKTIIFILMTGILRELASSDNNILDLILQKISQGVSKLNPMHIELLLHILVCLLKCPNFSRHFTLSLLRRLIQVVGSPSIRSQLSIIETTAKFLVELSSNFYTKVETKDPCSYSDIESNTLQIFSILLNSPSLQAVNKAMDLIVYLNEEMKSKLSPTILAKFDSIYEKFTEIQENDDALTSFILSDSNSQSLTSLFISAFIIKFQKLAFDRKVQLLSILKRILQLKNKNVSLISNIINRFCPKRVRNNLTPKSSNINISIGINEINLNEEKSEENEEKENQASKQILIPLSQYNKDPEFWQIIFDNLPWFQEQVNEHPNIIEDKFKFLKSYMELLTFKQKSVYFRKEQYDSKIRHRQFELQIRRKEILRDSFYELRPSSSKSKEKILSNIHIKFVDEPGFDMGGLTRDWFTSLVKELFNPNYALFKPSENCRSYQPNPSSSVNPYHLQYFEFAGLIIARAIIAGIYVDAHLTTSFIKQILGVEVTLRDLEDVDKGLYDSLVWVLNNSVNGLDFRFTTGFQDIDTAKTVELIEDGDNKVVTDDNKKEFVKLLCQHRMYEQIKDQIESFKSGFYKLISQSEIILFTPTELDLLICGVPEIDVDDLRKNCDFYYPYSPEHSIIKMFFNVISKWGHEDLAKLLLFITGSSQVPIGGFKMMKESKQPIIIAPGGDNSRLPQAHTCMNTLDLPNYINEEILEEKLLLSISECQNFGFN